MSKTGPKTKTVIIVQSIAINLAVLLLYLETKSFYYLIVEIIIFPMLIIQLYKYFKVEK